MRLEMYDEFGRKARVEFGEFIMLDGVEWLTLKVVHTTPEGALVRWMDTAGNIVAQCIAGQDGKIESERFSELQISIVPACEA
jgi:hypothetical protein